MYPNAAEFGERYATEAVSPKFECVLGLAPPRITAVCV